MKSVLKVLHAVVRSARGVVILGAGIALAQQPGVPCIPTGAGPDCGKCCTSRTTTTTTTACTASPVGRAESPRLMELKPRRGRIYLYVQDSSGSPAGGALVRVSIDGIPRDRGMETGSGNRSLVCSTDSNGMCSLVVNEVARAQSISASCQNGCISGIVRATIVAQ